MKLHRQLQRPFFIKRKWKSIMNRCYNPSSPNFLIYGAEGVLVAPAWHNSNTFQGDIEVLLREQGLELSDWGSAPGFAYLGRVDPAKPFSRKNCKFMAVPTASTSQKSVV